MSNSKLLNSNFKCKIGRTLYGWSGMVRLLGELRSEWILKKALRSKNQVYRCKYLGLNISLYAY